eukprot:TRINITY_DN122090_c0_g1_i1.p1 TRINITY_DN122090_c0_g1~~TRINITY_DN122090_c0_g1_i1.p1  ORF type:complete len:776 (+),score=177.26 TRINITY_DN122090_c0_g1_i1:43-2370(+)
MAGNAAKQTADVFSNELSRTVFDEQRRLINGFEDDGDRDILEERCIVEMLADRCGEQASLRGRAILDTWRDAVQTREEALSWLIRVFTSHHHRRTDERKGGEGSIPDFVVWDSWLATAISLVDRDAAASASGGARSQPIGMMTALAATLVALKLHGSAASLDEDVRKTTITLAKDIHGVCETFTVQAIEALWKKIRVEELRIISRVGYEVATPTRFDLAEQLANDLAAAAARCGDRSWERWKGCREAIAVLKPRSASVREAKKLQEVPKRRQFHLLATYLMELSILHNCEASYGEELPPLLLVFVAFGLSLWAFGGEPPAVFVTLLEKLRRERLTVKEEQEVPVVAKQVWKIWRSPPSNSVVAEKWRQRAQLWLPAAISQLPEFLSQPLPPKALAQEKPADNASPSRGAADAIVEVSADVAETTPVHKRSGKALAAFRTPRAKSVPATERAAEMTPMPTKPEGALHKVVTRGVVVCSKEDPRVQGHAASASSTNPPALAAEKALDKRIQHPRELQRTASFAPAPGLPPRGLERRLSIDIAKAAAPPESVPRRGLAVASSSSSSSSQLIPLAPAPMPAAEAPSRDVPMQPERLGEKRPIQEISPDSSPEADATCILPEAKRPAVGEAAKQLQETLKGVIAGAMQTSESAPPVARSQSSEQLVQHAQELESCKLLAQERLKQVMNPKKRLSGPVLPISGGADTPAEPVTKAAATSKASKGATAKAPSINSAALSRRKSTAGGQGCSAAAAAKSMVQKKPASSSTTRRLAPWMNDSKK